MNKSLQISSSVDELLSDLGRIPEPVFAMVRTQSDLSAKYKAALLKRKKNRRKKK